MQGAKIDLIRNSQLNETQTENLQIEQGSTYELPLTVTGDKTAGTWAGEIRTDNLANPDSQLLASFVFNNIAYTSGSGQTTLLANIPADVTRTIPPTLQVGESRALNNGYYVYSIKYTEGVQVNRNFYGLVEVDAQITDTTPPGP